MDVSVIIVSWNTKDLLNDCIKSVIQQAGEVAYEVIVVDNASSDGSVEMVRREFPQVKLVVETSNRGYAGAVNDGLAASSGRYVLALNSDILVCDGAVEKSVRYADGHPEAAVVGCQIKEGSDKGGMSCSRFPSLLNLLLETFGLNRMFPKNKFFGRERMTWWSRDNEREVDVISGMFMLVRRQAVDEVGPMDDRFFFLFEETDWCRRFSRAGWKMLFWPGASVIHVHGGGQSRKKAGVKIAMQYQKGMLIFFRKHNIYVEYLLARLILIVQSAVRCFAWEILRICRALAGKDTQYEEEKMRVYWWSFWFCVIGVEPGQVKFGRFIRRVATLIKTSIKILWSLVYRAVSFRSHELPVRIVLSYHLIRKQDVVGFEKQMQYLAARCRVVKASEILTLPRDGTKPLVAVIFDDAFSIIRDNAFPVLSRYGLPASVAVPVGEMGKPLNWLVDEDFDEQDGVVLDANAVVDMDRQGYEILSHTVSHRDLTQLDEAELQNELCASKASLEQMLGHRVDGLVYPYGALNTAVCEAAAKAEYRFGFSLEPQTAGQSVNNLCIGRFNVSPNESMLQFKLKTQGAYQVVDLLRRLKRVFRGDRWAYI